MAAQHVPDLQQEDEHERTSHGGNGVGIHDGGDLVCSGGSSCIGSQAWPASRGGQGGSARRTTPSTTPVRRHADSTSRACRPGASRARR
ncbi:hypothetical protein N136_01028 [Leifsonia aquatica ATCC 14665]|uniref:Uncharacterized protein n=1 Tax=Leifsonia aquatica ATCC 14665 TaxID=1358026 RepID=U2T546_LEIAQ|nr:hypothetical protein N136_01028 [Leifsonia aquatica ATCC 14665]